jgi:sugar phosphate isomerase/epimerase
MLPGDFRTHTPEHFDAINELGFTGAGFHFPGEEAGSITSADIDASRALFSDSNIDLSQMAVTYKECLFDPDPAPRKLATQKIIDTAAIASALSAQHFLIRPGSRNQAGSWTPHRENHTEASWALFVETLSEVAEGLDKHGVIAVMESHLVSIIKNPEACVRMVDEVGSPNLRIVMDYVNHFESLDQVYASANRLDHIFDTMGTLSPVMHIKDISLGKGLVLHIEESIPGTGELDLAHCFTRFHNLFPDGYGLIEHLAPALIPEATHNTRSIANTANIPIT